MALKRLKNGQFVIGSKAQAKEALELLLEKQEAATELRQENGIDELEMDATELKRAATRYFADKRIKSMAAGDKSFILVEGTDGMWIETKADIPADAPKSVKSLKSIVGSAIWRKITTRRLDPQKLQEAFNSGLIDEDKVAAAYYERPRAPYLRGYAHKDGDDA